MRAGNVIRHLTGFPHTPFGTRLFDGANASYHIGHEGLQPNDRVVLYTDGVVEARDASGEFFGVERLEDLLTRTADGMTPVPDTMRRLIHAVLDHQLGPLYDDATLLMVEWNLAGD